MSNQYWNTFNALYTTVNRRRKTSQYKINKDKIKINKVKINTRTEKNKEVNNPYWNAFNAQNERNRSELGRNQCIKIKNTYSIDDNCIMVVYDDCRYRYRAADTLIDIINSVMCGEIYIDTGKMQLCKYF